MKPTSARRRSAEAASRAIERGEAYCVESASASSESSEARSSYAELGVSGKRRHVSVVNAVRGDSAARRSACSRTRRQPSQGRLEARHASRARVGQDRTHPRPVPDGPVRQRQRLESRKGRREGGEVLGCARRVLVERERHQRDGCKGVSERPDDLGHWLGVRAEVRVEADREGQVPQLDVGGRLWGLLRQRRSSAGRRDTDPREAPHARSGSSRGGTRAGSGQARTRRRLEA